MLNRIPNIRARLVTDSVAVCFAFDAAAQDRDAEPGASECWSLKARGLKVLGWLSLT
jgi:hypothetical protein